MDNVERQFYKVHVTFSESLQFSQLDNPIFTLLIYQRLNHALLGDFVTNKLVL